MIEEIKISVLIPTFNPAIERLNKALEGLKDQDLDKNSWELIIVDNNSDNNFEKSIDLSWHPNSFIIKEEKQGLTYARIAGFKKASAALVIMVDDDNILNSDYLSKALNFLNENNEVGAVGGKSIPYFEKGAPSEWANEFLPMLALRDLGSMVKVSQPGFDSYPNMAPIGAGMVLRKNLLEKYIEYILSGDSVIKDRTGNSLASGGDNEINILILKQGYSIAYCPELELKHIIPPSRLTLEYLSKLNFESSRSWVKLLHKHNICPWPAISKTGAYLRIIKSFFNYKPWLGPVNKIKWAGARGQITGLSEIK